MTRSGLLPRGLVALGAGAVLVAALSAHGAAGAGGDVASTAARFAGPRITGLRRLTEAQYRNTIADIFGPDIRVAGRFEPIVRPVHELIASGARDSSVSPSGLEQLDAIGRGVAAQVFDDKHRALFLPCQPHDEAAPDESCARAALLPLGRYLFRRPLTDAEGNGYVAMAGAAARTAHSFDKGLELGLAAMLESPQFLYIVETAQPDPQHPGVLVLDDYSRASRLSYTLWNTTPDAALLASAASGRLHDPAVLAATAAKMVKSPRFEDGIRAFFADMLLFERFDSLSKDPIIFPYFNSEVAAAMPEQMLRTITDHLLTRDGDYRQLFLTGHTFMTRALGGLYQVPVHKDKGWEPYQFAPGADRAGLLGQAGFLAIYSQTGRSSPTLRGRAIRELLLCQPVPNPPGNVNFTAVQDVKNRAMPTARVRLAAHMTDENCAGCHRLTDPLGLSLERFDGIGGWRTTENGAVIDPAGKLDKQDFSGAEGLGKLLAASPDASQCVASRALEYVRGQPSDDADAMVESLDSHFAASGYRIRALFLDAVTQPQVWEVKEPPLGAPTHLSLLER
ncbi:MAG: DUF1592 domain-containing protein [Sphingomonadales bacterium]|nr:DUF1592 domain-containing protein [Sphingomonadales bacterium]